MLPMSERSSFKEAFVMSFGRFFIITEVRLSPFIILMRLLTFYLFFCSNSLSDASKKKKTKQIEISPVWKTVERGIQSEFRFLISYLFSWRQVYIFIFIYFLFEILTISPLLSLRWCESLPLRVIFLWCTVYFYFSAL